MKIEGDSDFSGSFSELSSKQESVAKELKELEDPKIDWNFSDNPKDIVEQMSNFIEFKQRDIIRKHSVTEFMEIMKIKNYLKQKKNPDQQEIILENLHDEGNVSKNSEIFELMKEHRKIFKQKFIEKVRLEEIQQKSQKKKKKSGKKYKKD